MRVGNDGERCGFLSKTCFFRDSAVSENCENRTICKLGKMCIRDRRWIDLKEDDFTILPAFQRITREFADYINYIDKWLKEE